MHAWAQWADVHYTNHVQLPAYHDEQAVGSKLRVKQVAHACISQCSRDHGSGTGLDYTKVAVFIALPPWNRRGYGRHASPA